MKGRLLLLFSLLFLGTSYTSMGQGACPDNIDFETGTTNVWNYFIGSCCSSSGTVTGMVSTTPLANRHRLTSGTAVDPFGGFPIVAPGGGSYSLKLGNSGVNYQAERARYYVHVPTGISNYALIYRFAIVLEDPSHPASIQPRFEVNAIDSATGTPVSCAQYSYVAGSLAGFMSSSVRSDTYYLPWTTASINLSGLSGSTIMIDFTSADCGAGGHFGYGYLDMNCTLFQLATLACDSNRNTLSGPYGYAHYSWYDSSTFASVLDTNQTTTFYTTTPTTYALVLTPFTGFGCPDTLYTRITPSNLQLAGMRDTTLCFSSGITLDAGATDIIGPLTYSWSPATGLSCTTCANPVATPTGAMTYYVTVTNPAGCQKSDTINIFGDLIPVSVTTTPTTCYGTSDGTASVTSTATLSYVWSSSPPQYTATATGLPAGTYTVTVTDSIGCTGNITATVTQPPQIVMPIAGSNGPVCSGDTLKIDVVEPTTGCSFSWTGPGGFTSTSQNFIITPAVFADSGMYRVVVSRAGCYAYDSTYVNIKESPVPFANNNSPFCAGGTLALTGSSSNGATSYTWAGPSFYASTLQNPTIDNAQATATGVYTVTVFLNGCSRTATTNVVVNPIPPAPGVVDTEYCQDDISVPLSATGTNLLWYDAPDGVGVSTAPTPSTVIPGTYYWYVTQTSAAGCMSAQSQVKVVVDPMPIISLSMSDSVMCVGNQVTFMTGNIGEAISKIVWRFGTDSVVGINPISYVFDRPGTFTVSTQTYYKKCHSQALSKDLNVFPTPKLDLGRDTVICGGSGVVFLNDHINASNPNAKWQWSNGEKNANITVSQPGLYYAKVIVNGCEATDSVLITKDCYVNFPNVFSPNGDGINDYFFPRDILSKGLTAFTMDIYNRWGQLVFNTAKTEGKGWDGRMNEVPQPEGVYIFVIDATFRDGRKEHHQGNVTLLR